MPDQRQVNISTPLSDDLQILSMSISESLGQLFQYDLVLYSPNEEIDIDAILGENVTVSLELGSGGKRYFNGIVSRFSQTGRSESGYALYQATLRPWFWFLTRTSDCRIFQNKSVPDIIKEIFGDKGFSDYEERLDHKKYRAWEYCVQYRETDFNFITRLMEQEGIYYFFRHEDGKHHLVLADGYESHQPIDEKKIRYYLPGVLLNEGGEPVISDWHLSREVQPGNYVLADYDFKKPRTELRVSSPIARQHAASDYEIYDYPGQFTEHDVGDHYARTRIEALHVQFEQVTAQTDSRTMTCGGLFHLIEHPRTDQNREYLVTSINTEITANDPTSAGTSDIVYRCSFAAIESKTPYRMPCRTAKPMIQGLQTAIVVGPEGEEIYPDKFGRVKVQFHWDRYGKRDENSSCWVRVAQPWAGQNWGVQFIPRIGQEVIVEFLEGDPDRPVITGSLYNAAQMPPYPLPSKKTWSGLKSRSTKQGAASNANEIRFDDKKGSELFYIQAEKDQRIVIKNDKNESIGSNVTINVGNDKKESVGHDENLTVVNDRLRSVNNNETVTISKFRTHNVGLNEMINIGGAQEVNVGAFHALDVGGYQMTNIGLYQDINVGGKYTLSIGGNRETKVEKNDDLEVEKDRISLVKGNESLKVEKKLVYDVADEIEIRNGSSKITMKKDGKIVISGTDVMLKTSSGKVHINSSGTVIIKGTVIKEN